MLVVFELIMWLNEVVFIVLGLRIGVLIMVVMFLIVLVCSILLDFCRVLLLKVVLGIR